VFPTSAKISAEILGMGLCDLLQNRKKIFFLSVKKQSKSIYVSGIKQQQSHRTEERKTKSKKLD
jgi:hypothetical protein